MRRPHFCWNLMLMNEVYVLHLARMDFTHFLYLASVSMCQPLTYTHVDVSAFPNEFARKFASAILKHIQIAGKTIPVGGNGKIQMKTTHQK